MKYERTKKGKRDINEEKKLLLPVVTVAIGLFFTFRHLLTDPFIDAKTGYYHG